MRCSSYHLGGGNKAVSCIKLTAQLSFVLLALLQGPCPAQAEGIYSNSWVRPSARGNLLYRHDAHGERICDFSDCGYKGGVVEPPEPFRMVDASRWINVTPQGNSGDAGRIQNAIDTVSQFSLNSNGFRGIVFLGAGEFKVNRTLFITNGGIML